VTDRNNGRWTEARYRSFITSCLRGGFRRWPPKFDVLRAALVGRKINPKSGREANHYRCAECDGQFVQTNVQVDHKVPIGSWSDWNVAIEALFCEADNLQVLCKPCHKAKTKQEKEKKNKNESKVNRRKSRG
jgi:5-methylcytosine-specific restriction endonuclease McrA